MFVNFRLEEPNKGETVEVECIEGYTLEGESTLTCGNRNDYTARKLPECVPIAGCETPIIGSSFFLKLLP